MAMFGRVDRGGSREGKKSLRTNKIALAKASRDQGKDKPPEGPSSSPAPPVLLDCTTGTTPGGAPLIDCGVQLLSRQFDRDQLRVMSCARTSGVGAMIAYTTDYDKAEGLVRTAKEGGGQVYCMVGVHSDMIKRHSDRLSAARLDALKELVMRPDTVALMAGLDFSRDMATRYAQERALQEQLDLGVAAGLPLVLFDVKAAEALAERVAGLRASGEAGAAEARVAVFNFGGSAEDAQAYRSQDCYFILTGR